MKTKIKMALAVWIFGLAISSFGETVTVLNETFEGNFPADNGWQLSGSPTWNDTSYYQYGGTWCGYCAGSVTDHGPYVANMNAWMIYGPFSLADASAAEVNLMQSYQCEDGCDFIKYAVSTDGSNFSICQQYSGWNQGWDGVTINLTDTPLGNLCGNSEVWFAVIFTSDGSVQQDGAYVDNISIQKTLVAVPQPPTGLSATDGTYSDKVHLSWNTSATAYGYDVYRNTANDSSTATWLFYTTSTAQDDTSVTPGIKYYYWVKAKNAAGSSGFSSGDSGYAGSVPSAPTGLNASDGTYSDRIHLSWNASATAYGYDIYRNTVNDSSTAIWLFYTTSTAQDDTSVTSGILYYYWIKAKNAAGSSGFSSGNSGYAGSLCSISVTPSSRDFGSVTVSSSADLTFTVQNSGGGTLSGSASVSSPFSIISGGSYSLGAGQSQTVTVRFSPSSVGSYNQTVTFTGGGGATRAVTGTGVTVSSPVISVTPSSLDFGSVVVSPGSSALASFTVQNTGGGTLSGSASVSSPFSIYSGGTYSLGAGQSQSVTIKFYPTSAGTYNQTVTFTGGGGTTRPVTGQGVNAYTITPSAGSGGTISPSSPVTVTAGGSKTFTASPNSGYSVDTWSVDGSAVQSGGSSYTLSNIQANHTVSVSFKQNGTVPVPPTGVSASDGIYSDKVRVTWNASSGVTSYEVWRNTSDNSASAVKLGDSTACGYDDDSAAEGTTHFYWVKAKNATGTSGFSSSDSGYCLLCNKIYLQAGTLAGQTIGSLNRQITVEPGARITGSFNVQVHNIMSSSAIAPLAATPTWGTPASVYWGITPYVRAGDNTYNIPVNITAPSVAGTYYIVAVMAGTYNYAQLMSGTHPGYTADWVNGNIVAELPAGDFETAATQGWIPFDWYTPNGPASGTIAMTTIKVIVSGNGPVEIEPAIRINDSTSLQVTLHRGNQLRLDINLDTNSGLDADWWVVVETPFGWYYYSAYDGLWRPTSSSNLHVTYQGGLFDFFSPYEVLDMNTAWLQTGTYVFYFGVDTSQNGRLDWDTLRYAWVILNIVN